MHIPRVLITSQARKGKCGAGPDLCKGKVLSWVPLVQDGSNSDRESRGGGGDIGKKNMKKDIEETTNRVGKRDGALFSWNFSRRT